MEKLASRLNCSVARILREFLRVNVLNPPAMLQLWRMRHYQQRAAELRLRHEEQGLSVPPFLIASITRRCNLRCEGCYARHFETPSGVSPASIGGWRKIFAEARDLGVGFILLAGGEPLLCRDVLGLAAEFPGVFFPVFTNGTMLDGDALELLSRNRNLLPLLSLEGGGEETELRRGEGLHSRLQLAMKDLRRRRIFFGASITVTHGNLQTVTSKDFLKSLRRAGCRLVIFVEYVPAGASEHMQVLSDEDRSLLAETVETMERRDRLPVLSFPGDEPQMGGCLAAGRGFFHINAEGWSEPCPFSPFADVDVVEHGVRAALASPFFASLRERNLTDVPHEGGCTLWANRAEVSQLHKERESTPLVNLTADAASRQ